MGKCEWCGKDFDVEDAEELFDTEFLQLCYANIRKCLCGECAVQAIEDEVDGIYFEICEKCGAEFDYIEDSGRFDSNFNWENGTNLTDYWDEQILCCDCALRKVEEEDDKF